MVGMISRILKLYTSIASYNALLLLKYMRVGMGICIVMESVEKVWGPKIASRNLGPSLLSLKRHWFGLVTETGIGRKKKKTRLRLCM